MIKTAFIIILFISGLAIFRTWYLFKKEKATIKNAIFWTVLWIIVCIGVLLPKSLDFVMKLVMMENRLFFISVMGIFILLIITYNLSIAQKKTERAVSKIVQELAILNHKMDLQSKASPDLSTKERKTREN